MRTIELRASASWDGGSTETSATLNVSDEEQSMAIYYAHKAGNINADDVWFDAASGGSGVTGATALDGTHTLRANSYAIAINVDFTAVQIDTLTSGGSFTISDARTITTDIQAGTSTVVVTSKPGATYTFTIVGNLIGSAAGAGRYCISNTVAVHLDITGNVTGGSGTTAYAIRNTSTGNIRIAGNVTAGAGVGALAVSNENVGVVTVYQGNIIHTDKSQALTGAVVWDPVYSNYVQFAGPDATTISVVIGLASDVIEGANCGAVVGDYHQPAAGEVLYDTEFGSPTDLHHGLLTLPNNGTEPYTPDPSLVLTTGYFGSTGGDGLTQGTAVGGGGAGGGSVFGSGVITPLGD